MPRPRKPTEKPSIDPVVPLTAPLVPPVPVRVNRWVTPPPARPPIPGYHVEETPVPAPRPAILVPPVPEKTGKKAARLDDTLAEWQQQYAHDPLGFVHALWPWGEPGTFIHTSSGPDQWQEEVLTIIGKHYQEQTNESLLLAVASGHGIGKTALSMWVVLWFLAMHPHCQVAVTGAVGHQIMQKIWRELFKWLSISPLADYFQWSPTKCSSRLSPEDWFGAGITNNPGKPEGFAGLHDKHVCIILDEASSIDSIIWETIEGALTGGKALWLAIGNPLNPTGRFRDCFPGGRYAQRWRSLNVDSRNARMADKADIQHKLDAYGEDSDYFKMRVAGQFPTRGSQQLIGEDMLQAAKSREYVPDPYQPIIVGVDVARYGDCRSVILVRQGALILEKRTFSNVDVVQLAGFVVETIDKYGSREQAVDTFIDSVGLGAGVVDHCKARGYKVQELLSGNPANDSQHFANKRAELAYLMKEWIRTHACLQYDRDLEADLVNIQYFYNVKGQLQIESKEDMRARGVASPDVSDSLSYTFSEVNLGQRAGTWGS